MSTRPKGNTERLDLADNVVTISNLSTSLADNSSRIQQLESAGTTGDISPSNVSVGGVLSLEGGTANDAAINSGNRDNTYIRFAPAGSSNDWAYLRQIGGDNQMKMALDFHDDSDDCKFLIRGVHSSGQDPDVITNRFSVVNDKVGCGTDSPVAKLHVASNGPTYTAIGGNDRFRIEELVSNGNKFGLQMGIDWGTGHSALQTYALSSAGAYSQNYDLLLQPYGGNVGIGVTTFTDTRNTGGLHLANSKGISFAASTNSGSRHWRIRTDDYSDHGSLQIGVSGDNSTCPDSAGEAVMTMTRDRRVGIGRSDPDYLLDVNGTTRVGNVLYVGKNTNDETAKSIFFGGTYGDNDYNNAVIERRVWSTGTEKQELLLFSGNDGETTAGPDRIRLKGANILFDTLSGTQNARTTANTKMIIKANGRVGIGTLSPAVPLHVNATASASVGDTHVWVTSSAKSGGYPSGVYDGGFGANISNQQYTYSIKAAGAVSSTRFILHSDERIKKNIVDVEDDEALVKLRMLHPKKYRFIDESAQGSHQVYGFLANEVQEVLPDAVVEHTNEIPSIYQLANVSNSSIITFSDFDTSKLQSNTLVAIGIDQLRHKLTVDEIIDSTSVRVVEDLSAVSGSLDEHGNVLTETQTLSITPEEYEDLEDKDGFKPISDDSNVITEYTKTTTTYVGDQLFVYGEVVDDFKHLQESAISTLSTAALQEVDRIQQQHDAQIADLEAAVTSRDQQIDELRSQLSDIVSRLEAVESG